MFFENKINYITSTYILITHLLSIYSIQYIDSITTLGEVFLWYQICCLGVTAGLHRLWSHRSYKAKDPTRFLLMILASVSNQGTIYHWCRDHRVHHKHSDTNSDPHNINRGFFFSHMGWLMLKKNKEVIESGKKIDCSDLLDDWIVKFNYDYFPYWNKFWCFIFPGLYGLYFHNSFMKGFLLFGVLRWTIQLHATWCVNSLSHSVGYRPFRKNIKPTENLFV